MKKKDTGEVVKCHDSAEEAEKHLVALRINVKESMEANLILGHVKFLAEQEDPRFLRFKRAVLARAETNGNRDAVGEKELQEVAATIVGTAIDLEHFETDNYGVFTGAAVEPDPEYAKMPGIPTLFVDGYFWRHRLEARNIKPEQIEKGEYKLSIEADADEAECSVCKQVFKTSAEYCGHIDSIAHKLRYGASRVLRGLRAMGGALTKKPAGSEAGFARSTIYMVASHMEAPHEEKDDTTEFTDADFYAFLSCLMEYEDDDHEMMGEKTPEKPYGDVRYADPGYQKDKKKRYPIDSEKHIRAAWNYINKAKNAAKYSSEHLSTIKKRIISAWKRAIDKSGPPSVAEKPTQEASMSEEEVRATTQEGADKPKTEPKEVKVEASIDKAKVSEMEATIKDLSAKLEAAKKEKEASDKANEELKSQLKASKTELLRSQLVGAVLEADEFEKQLDALLLTPPEAVALMLRPRKEIEQVKQRMAVAAAEKAASDEELTV